jgi:cytochrome c553
VRLLLQDSVYHMKVSLFRRSPRLRLAAATLLWILAVPGALAQGQTAAAAPADIPAQETPASAAVAPPPAVLVPQGADSPAGVLIPGTMAARTAACTSCHGAQGRAGSDGYYPRLAGKPAEYLYHQLLNFRDGKRQYRPMSYLLHNLPDAYLREIAVYFSEQHLPYPDPQRGGASAAMLEKGRLLTSAGDPERKLPACVACHGAALSGLAPAIPGLLGLPRDYIGAQIGSWKTGLRRAAAPDCMADVAQRLTPEDIAAVSAWLSAQTVAEPYAPQPAGALRTPAECGSQAVR